MEIKDPLTYNFNTESRVSKNLNLENNKTNKINNSKNPIKLELTSSPRQLNKSHSKSFLQTNKRSILRGTSNSSSDIESVELINEDELNAILDSNNQNNQNNQNIIFNKCSFKVILIGNSNVGKTSLLKRVKLNEFSKTKEQNTVGFDYFDIYMKVTCSSYCEIIKLAIWDTCGMESYRSLISSFYRNAELAIILYSIDE